MSETSILWIVAACLALIILTILAVWSSLSEKLENVKSEFNGAQKRIAYSIASYQDNIRSEFDKIRSTEALRDRLKRQSTPDHDGQATEGPGLPSKDDQILNVLSHVTAKIDRLTEPQVLTETCPKCEGRGAVTKTFESPLVAAVKQAYAESAVKSRK